MTCFIISFLLLQSLSEAHFNSWEFQNPPVTGSCLNDITFGRDSTLWIVGGQGTILHSDDNGTTWFHSTINSNKSLHSIVFANNDTGWAVGGGGFINNPVCLGTTDGGKTWTLSHTFDEFTSLRKVYCTSKHKIWLVGKGTNTNALVWNSTLDKWEGRRIGEAEIYDLVFMSDSIGLAVGENGYIGRTEDGGMRWQKVMENPGGAITNIAMPCKDTGYVFGTFGLYSEVLRTVDGGKSWKNCHYFFYRDFSVLVFKNAKKGVVISFSKNAGVIIEVTTNGGESWSSHKIPISACVRDFQFTGPSKGIAICLFGEIYEITIPDHDNIEFSQKTQNNGNRLLTVDGYDEQNVLTCGTFKPSALVTSNGGTNWSKFSIPSVAQGVLYFKSGCAVIFCRDTIYRTVNGGGTWISEEQEGDFEHCSKFGSKFAIVTLSVPRNPQKLIITRDAGQTWKPAASPSIETRKKGTHFFDSSTIWACSRKHVAKSSNMGNTWEVVNKEPLPGGWSNAIFFLSDSIGFLGGGVKQGGGTKPCIFRTIDGGKTWQRNDLSLKCCHGLSQESQKSGSSYTNCRAGAIWFVGENFSIIRYADSFTTTIHAPKRVSGIMMQKHPLFLKTPLAMYTLAGRRIQPGSTGSRYSRQFFLELHQPGNSARVVLPFRSHTIHNSPKQ